MKIAMYLLFLGLNIIETFLMKGAQTAQHNEQFISWNAMNDYLQTCNKNSNRRSNIDQLVQLFGESDRRYVRW